MPYGCVKFERSCTTGRLFLGGSKILQKQCKEEEKCEENWAIFGSVYLVHHQSDFFQI